MIERKQASRSPVQTRVETARCKYVYKAISTK